MPSKLITSAPKKLRSDWPYSSPSTRCWVLGAGEQRVGQGKAAGVGFDIVLYTQNRYSGREQSSNAFPLTLRMNGHQFASRQLPFTYSSRWSYAPPFFFATSVRMS